MSRLAQAAALACLVGLLGLLFFWRLGDLPLAGVGEPRESVVVAEVMAHGDWILPLRNGTEIPSKPPLLHWAASAIGLASGRLDARIVRLPSALLASATVLAVVWFGARRWSAAAGLYAGFILATSIEFLRYARLARVDMTLTACLTAAWMCLDRALASPLPPPLPLWGFYVFMGLATLAKGPLGLVLPALAALTYLALRGELGRWRTLRVGRGFAVALAIPLVWYLLASAVGGMAFIHKQVLRENLLHFVDTGRVTRTRARPIYYYVVALAGGLAPWSVFLPLLGARLLQLRRQAAVQPYLLPLVWCAVVLGFFTLAASKRASYLLVAYPAAAVMLGAWWSELERESDAYRAPLRWLSLAAAGLAAATAALVLIVLFFNAVGRDALEWIRPLLHRRDQANLPLVRTLLAERWPMALAAAAALA
ncbi:MAG: ArnT family glycosyltransferase, partial [Candidatus Binatia bacterium]